MDVTILRVNDEEYILGLHWSGRRFWRAPPGLVQIKLLCSMVSKTGFGRSAASEAKLMAVKLEAGHYYQFTCEKFQPDYVDRGSDPAVIPELTAR